jgi:hypothetical protein
MPKHDELKPASEKGRVNTTEELDELCDLWNDKGGEKYLGEIDYTDHKGVREAFAMVATVLADLAHLHTICKAGRANPKYWRGSRTARN